MSINKQVMVKWSPGREAFDKNLRVWILTLFAAFGGFMFGYDTGVINGVLEMDGFRMTFGFSDNSSEAECADSEGADEGTILGLIVSMFSIGCLAGALVAGAVSDWVGRKLAIIMGGVIFTIGAIFQSSAYFVWMIILGRIVAGIGVGVLSMVVPIYNAELAPKSLRGRLVSLNQLAITAGIMASFIIGLACSYFLAGWRVALGVQCLFGVILIIGMLFLPETPRWLVKKHRDEKASRVLVKLRCTSPEEVKSELEDIQASIRESEMGGARPWWWTWRALLRWRMIQRVFIGVGIQIFQQLTGMNVIMYYSTSIFSRIGVESYVSTAIVGTLNFLTTILSIFLVDKIGRKALLLLGSIGMLFSMLLAATLIISFRVGLPGGNPDTDKHVGYVIVMLVCFFVFNFAYSWGPVAWVVTSEIFPLDVRGAAVSITTAGNWTGNFLVAMLTPVLILCSPLEIHGTFYLLSGALLLGFFFVLLTLPETKGESLERIEELFSQQWLKRINLFYYLRCGCPWQCRRDASHMTAVTFTPSPNKDEEEHFLLPNEHKADNGDLID